jgi:hypothetical protein
MLRKRNYQNARHWQKKNLYRSFRFIIIIIISVLKSVLPVDTKIQFSRGCTCLVRLTYLPDEGFKIALA